MEIKDEKASEENLQNISETVNLFKKKLFNFNFFYLLKIEGMLKQTREKFETVSEQILRRIDEMAQRVNDLEKNITDIMTDAGVDTENIEEKKI